jgi:dTMP kinase
MLVSIEGIDCCGKDTVLQALLPQLAYANPRAMSDFHWSTATDMKSLAIREPNPFAQVSLFHAARLITHRNIVAQLLSVRTLVIYNRYVDSTLAYSPDSLRSYIADQHILAELPVPALTLLLDIPITLMRERMATRGKPLDEYERRPDSYFERVRENFVQLATKSTRHVVIDATAPLDAVVARCVDLIEKRVIQVPPTPKRIHIEGELLV